MSPGLTRRRRALALAAFSLVAPALAGCLAAPAPGVRPLELPIPGGLACAPRCEVGIAEDPWLAFEVSAAVDPEDADHLLLAFIDAPVSGRSGDVIDPFGGFGPGYFTVATAVSFDGGQTWDLTRLPTAASAPTGSRWALFCSTADPSVFFGPSGAAFLLGWANGCEGSHIFLAKSGDGGRTWGEPSLITSTPGAARINDKPWAAFDTASGRIAVTWTGFTACTGLPGLGCAGDELLASVSDDGGDSWSPPAVVSRGGPVEGTPVWQEGSLNHYNVPAWGNDGALHVSYRACERGCVKVASSFDGGATWEERHRIDLVHQDRPEAFYQFQVLDADRSGGPWDGRLYLSYKSAPAGDYDVFLTWSDDGARTWAGPVLLNDNPGDGTDQFHHWMDVDDEGLVHAMFFDHRGDPANNLTRVTYASFDPATGTLRNLPVSETWVLFPAGKEPFVRTYGDYEGIAASGGTVLAAWGRVTEPKPGVDPTAYAARYDIDVRAAVLRP